MIVLYISSNKPKVASLSKNLIALLHYGGVPSSVFLVMLRDALSKPLAPLYRTKAALRGNVVASYPFALLQLFLTFFQSIFSIDSRSLLLLIKELKCVAISNFMELIVSDNVPGV